MKTLHRFALLAAGTVLAAIAATASAQMVNTPGPNGQTPSADVTIAHPAQRASGPQKGSTSVAAWRTATQADKPAK